MKENEYTRRNFLKQNTLAGIGLLVAGTFTGTLLTKEAHAKIQPKFKRNMTISDLNLAQLRENYKEALFAKFLPNMDALVIDHELGGFMCSVDILTRKLVSTQKRAWFEGRGIWTY